MIQVIADIMRTQAVSECAASEWEGDIDVAGAIEGYAEERRR